MTLASNSVKMTAPWRQSRRSLPVLGDRTSRPLIIALIAVCEIAGIAALVTSYSIALTTETGEAEFVFFWSGILLTELPVAVLIARRVTSAVARSALLVLLGILSYAPKLLRDPAGPDFHDEFAHWRSTYNILATGKLFQPAQVVTIISRYPGLHSATAALVNITGLDIWQAATLVLLTMHVSLLLGIFALAQATGLNSRAAAFAAIVYSFNASFLYFDAEFGYESMAITLAVWTLVAFVRALRAAPGREKTAWCRVTVLLSFGTVVTHHLTSIDLTLIMALVSVTLSVPGLARRDDWARTARTAWGLTLVMGLMTGLWIFFVAPGTVAYLSPYLGTGLTELLRAAGGSGGGRQLFQASLSPWWEHDAAFLVTVVALFLVAGGILLTRNRIRQRLLPSGRPRALLAAFCLLGLVYFPSTLFILSPAGAEGARRSWAVSFIGLALVTGPVVVWLIEWADHRIHLLSRIGARVGLSAVMALSLVGGTSAGLDASYRFPGPFMYGSDTRSETPELDAMSQWFLDRFGPGHNVVTDRYTGLVIASFGLQDTANPSAGFPVYDLYLDKPGQPIGPAFLLQELGSSNYLYLIVDKRMAVDAPQVGAYFEGYEPPNLVLPDGQPVFHGLLSKFNTISWMDKVFDSDNYSVYRMNLPAPAGQYQKRDVTFHGKLSVGQ
ncbi:MAG TPA: hypothetical protein VG164_02255 [Trebonia sp.]|nr:hypothetical protein [Trebonia sp.]